jgi:phospholipase C
LLDFEGGFLQVPSGFFKRESDPMAGKIEHVVIIVKENHTFDNYFGTFEGADGATVGRAENPALDDPDHKHQTWMDRAGDSVHRVQYKEGDIPLYFKYARDFTLCDKYFSEVAGPSTPNHLMLICADVPIINNPAHHYRPLPNEGYKLKSLPLDWRKLTSPGATMAATHFTIFRNLRAITAITRATCSCIMHRRTAC